MSFPKGFVWGTAASSYQIEGAWQDSSKGPSIWDDFCAEPGRVRDGSDGRVACDHYRLFREDVELMARMGVKNYRLSISWPRVMPEGTGRVNQAGLDFYVQLADCLLAHGIRPLVTLYHWDLPSALHQRGAWLNPDMPEWFAEYTRTVAQALGERVKDYITLNEPQCIINLGYETCEHAPGIRFPLRDTVRMAHNVLKSHGRAVQVLRETVPGVRVGYAPCGDVMMPLTDSPEDIEAARKAYFAPSGNGMVGFNTAWFSDPVCLGRYPEDGLKLLGQYLPEGWEKDMPLISEKLDFYCQNIYNGQYFRAADNAQGYERVEFAHGWPRTTMGWPVTPDALYWGPKFLHERYGLPIVISENGMACPDAVAADGEVHDPNRVEYIRRYLKSLKRAVDDGVPVEGYFYWSFWDNFEWAHGYTQRFGLTYVDFQTLERIPKDSCRFYKTVMETNGENL
ncbi:MAG: beta-glucosidase [Clostridia bacterium]|nr:beta-glucosidase [Clostridia bacterium]